MEMQILTSGWCPSHLKLENTLTEDKLPFQINSTVCTKQVMNPTCFTFSQGRIDEKKKAQKTRYGHCRNEKNNKCSRSSKVRYSMHKSEILNKYRTQQIFKNQLFCKAGKALRIAPDEKIYKPRQSGLFSSGISTFFLSIIWDVWGLEGVLISLLLSSLQSKVNLKFQNMS